MYSDNLSSLVSLLKPFPDRIINSKKARTLYHDVHLTPEEYVLLDYLGAINELKHGETTISFQGLKRKISLHQARLTKALNRLIDKDLLGKSKHGYVLTNDGLKLANELMKKYGRQSTLERELHSHVVHGEVVGIDLTEDYRKQIVESLSGKWFGDFRFIAQTTLEDGSYEIEWTSINSSISAKVLIGNENKLSIIVFSSKIIHSDMQLQLLMERISSTVETIFDISILFFSQEIYKKNGTIQKLEDKPTRFAS